MSNTRVARDWDELSEEEQRAYLSRHPGSKRRVTGKPGVDSQRGDEKPQRPKRGDWGQKMRLRELRNKKYHEIKRWVDENKPYEEIDSKYPLVVYEMRKLDVVKGLEMAEDVKKHIMSDIERAIEGMSAGLDKGKIEKLYDDTKDINVDKMEQDDFVSKVVSESVRNKEYRDLMISLGQYANDHRSVSDEEAREYITDKYGDILTGTLGEKVDELINMDVDDAGARREGMRVPGTSKYMEDMSDDEIWKVYLYANRYHRNDMKPHEKWALEYIERNQTPLPMPFGKYKDLGWSAQDVIKKDKGYSKWLSDKIVEKGDKQSPFEKWFLEQYANEYLI